VCSFVGCTSASHSPATGGEATESGSPTATGELRLDEGQVRDELEFLYRSLQSAHYDLYAYRSKFEYDAAYQALSSRLSGPMSRLDLVREFQPFVAFGRIGHARIDFPVPEYIQAIGAGGTILPFDIRIENDRVFVTHAYGEDSRIVPGVELLSIDGTPIPDVVEHISRFVSGERPYMVNAQLETFFPRWYWVAHGNVDEIQVSARTADGESFVETIRGLLIAEVESRKSEWTEVLNSRELRFIDERTAYLRPGPFYNIDGGDSMDVAPFQAFINEAFDQISKKKSQTLLIDLRDNPGGDNSFSDLMVAWFATRPFRFSDDFNIKASAEIRQQLAKRSAEVPDKSSIVVQMYDLIADRPDGDIVPVELPKAMPREKRFEGEVFVLVSRHSYSNAASVAGMVQDYGFATIIGEETADLPTSYASSAQFTLPRSGIVVTYPKGYFVRPSGDTAVRGVIPDHSIAPDVWLQGPDAVLREALNLIATFQTTP